MKSLSIKIPLRADNLFLVNSLYELNVRPTIFIKMFFSVSEQQNQPGRLNCILRKRQNQLKGWQWAHTSLQPIYSLLIAQRYWEANKKSGGMGGESWSFFLSEEKCTKKYSEKHKGLDENSFSISKLLLSLLFHNESHTNDSALSYSNST